MSMAEGQHVARTRSLHEHVQKRLRLCAVQLTVGLSLYCDSAGTLGEQLPSSPILLSGLRQLTVAGEQLTVCIRIQTITLFQISSGACWKLCLQSS